MIKVALPNKGMLFEPTQELLKACGYKFWAALDSATELFLQAARYIAETTDLSFSEKDAEGLKEYLYKVKNKEYKYSE